MCVCVHVCVGVRVDIGVFGGGVRGEEKAVILTFVLPLHPCHLL